MGAGGNLVLSGKAASGIYFGGDRMLLGNDQPDMFMASFKINPLSPNLEPAYQWSKILGTGSTEASQGNAIALDPSGQVLTAGSFLDTVDFWGSALTAPLG